MDCVIYDGNCNLCVNLVRVLETLDQGQRFCYVPMQDRSTLARFGITPQDCEAGMILLELDHPRRRWQGSDAAEEIGRRLPAIRPLVAAYQAIPGLKPTGDQVYNYVRDHRYPIFGQRSALYESAFPLCDNGHCPDLATPPSR